MGLAIKIEKRFRGIDSPGKLKLATAGCPRNCSEAHGQGCRRGRGRAAASGRSMSAAPAGAHVRKGDLLCVVDSHDEVLR